MEIIWTPTARHALTQIHSEHFTKAETLTYKREFVAKVERTIELMGSSLPAHEPEWNGNYRIFVDSFRIYYSLSHGGSRVNIKFLKHYRQE